jgi:hypothetical protein
LLAIFATAVGGYFPRCRGIQPRSAVCGFPKENLRSSTGAAVPDSIRASSRSFAFGSEVDAVDYGKFEAKASPFRAGMKPTNSIQPPTVA